MYDMLVLPTHDASKYSPVASLLVLYSCTCHVKCLYMYWFAAQVAMSVFAAMAYFAECYLIHVSPL